MNPNSDLKKHLSRDLFWFIVSILVAILIVRSGIITHVLAGSAQGRLLGSFIAGLFFTSLFSIAPASIALVTLAKTTSIVEVALAGALGAMLGDLLIFQFIKSNLTDDLNEIALLPRYRKMKRLFSIRLLRILRPFIGAIVIISPLPDEIGLALLGFSKIPTIIMLPLTFILNFFGILLICYTAGLL